MAPYSQRKSAIAANQRIRAAAQAESESEREWRIRAAAQTGSEGEGIWLKGGTNELSLDEEEEEEEEKEDEEEEEEEDREGGGEDGLDEEEICLSGPSSTGTSPARKTTSIKKLENVDIEENDDDNDDGYHDGCDADDDNDEDSGNDDSHEVDKEEEDVEEEEEEEEPKPKRAKKAKKASVPVGRVSKKKTTPKNAPKTTPKNTTKGGGNATKMILNIVVARKAKFETGTDKKYLAVYTGITGASTIRNSLASLKKEGLVVVNGNDVEPTPKGVASVDVGAVDLNALISTDGEYHDLIKTAKKLSAAEVRLFDHIADGRSYLKEDVRSALKFEKNSTWRNLVAGLKKKEVLEYHPNDKFVRLVNDLFPFGTRAE